MLTASGFTLGRGGSSVVGRGRAGYNRPDHDQQSCIWLINLSELHDDARTCQCQIYILVQLGIPPIFKCQP